MKTHNLSQAAIDYRRVEQAILFLEANFREQPSLDEIAASVDLSKFHFQRLFKRWAGISPTQFVRFLTVEYAKDRLRDSQTVLDATFDAGLSSPSRLHDLFVTFEAMTPGEYKEQGEGLEIAYGFHATPFGEALLATTARGICALHFVPDGDRSTVLRALRERWPRATLVEDGAQTQPLIERIFGPANNGVRQPFHLLLQGTNFQVKVWQALLAIPPGSVTSYGDLAAAIGRPRAARAVGAAVGRNPIAYLIPCHRVITHAGEAHRYRWGTARKKAMLAWEAAQV